MLEDKELIRRTLGGDVDAFNRLYRMHHPRIFATLIGRTRNRDDAEDLTQQLDSLVHDLEERGIHVPHERKRHGENASGADIAGARPKQ